MQLVRREKPMVNKNINAHKNFRIERNNGQPSKHMWKRKKESNIIEEAAAAKKNKFTEQNNKNLPINKTMCNIGTHL